MGLKNKILDALAVVSASLILMPLFLYANFKEREIYEWLPLQQIADKLKLSNFRDIYRANLPANADKKTLAEETVNGRKISLIYCPINDKTIAARPSFLPGTDHDTPGAAILEGCPSSAHRDTIVPGDFILSIEEEGKYNILGSIEYEVNRKREFHACFCVYQSGSLRKLYNSLQNPTLKGAIELINHTKERIRYNDKSDWKAELAPRLT